MSSLVLPRKAESSQVGPAPTPPARLHRLRRRAVLGVAGVAAMLLFAAPASASFELVNQFPGAGEPGQISSAFAGLAVNEAPGPYAGDLYEADNTGKRVSRFGPQGEFLESWGWGVAADQAFEFERCGPDGEPAHPTCAPEGYAGNAAGQFGNPQGVGVDQATGDVYVLDTSRTTGVVQEFSPDGSHLIASFGEKGHASPEQIVAPIAGDGIAVDPAGDVYLVDARERVQGAGKGPNRVMVFSPTDPGNEHYAYAGELAGAEGLGATQVALDSGGDLFLSNASHVYKLAAPGLGAPPAWEATDECDIEGLTADPLSGEAFFSCTHGNSIVRLGPGGAQKESIKGLPGAEITPVLAYDATAVFGAGRPPGVFYAINAKRSETHPPVLAFARAVVHPPPSPRSPSPTSAPPRPRCAPRSNPTASTPATASSTAPKHAPPTPAPALKSRSAAPTSAPPRAPCSPPPPSRG